jgi:hypothetical protein
MVFDDAERVFMARREEQAKNEVGTWEFPGGTGEALELLRGSSAVNTWNARRAAVLSWLGWCRERGHDAPAVPVWAKRLATPDSQTPARSKMATDRLIARREVHLREQTFFSYPFPPAHHRSRRPLVDEHHLHRQTRHSLQPVQRGRQPRQMVHRRQPRHREPALPHHPQAA